MTGALMDMQRMHAPPLACMKIAPVSLARRLNLPSMRDVARPGMPRRSTKPRMSSPGTRAQITKTSAIGAFVILRRRAEGSASVGWGSLPRLRPPRTTSSSR